MDCFITVLTLRAFIRLLHRLQLATLQCAVEKKDGLWYSILKSCLEAATKSYILKQQINRIP